MMSLLLRRESVSHNIFVWDDKIVGWWKLLDVEDTTGGLCNCDWQPRWRMIPLLDTLLPAYLLSNYCPHLLQPPPHTGKQGGGRGGAGRTPADIPSPSPCLLPLSIYYLLSRALLPHRVTVCRTCHPWPLRCLQIQKWQISILFLPFDCLLTTIGEWTSQNFCSLIGSSICIYCKCVLHGQWIQTTIYLSTLDIIYIYLS